MKQNIVHAAPLKQSVQHLTVEAVRGKTVFVRSDLNVPLSESLQVTDDTRLREAVPTVKLLLSHGARVLLASHLGRPKGRSSKLSLKPVAEYLRTLGLPVHLADDCVGPSVGQSLQKVPFGEVLLLENTRFHAEEEKNDPEFSRQLAEHADLYVNDAFGCAHRAHASTEGVTHHLKPCVAGLLMQKELNYLEAVVKAPQRPFCAVVGGSKVSSKIDVLHALVASCDTLIIGGGMVFTFLAARGLPTGSSLVEASKVDMARQLEVAAKERGVKLLLPSDVVVARSFPSDTCPEPEHRIVAAHAIPEGWMGLDIGPDSCKAFSAALKQSRTVLWNGPMGVFERPAFAAGTNHVAQQLADCTAKGAITVVGGGDSVAAVAQAGLQDRMSHISTGGGAALELLEGRTLPGVAALDDQPPPVPAAWSVVLLAYYAAASLTLRTASMLLPNRKVQAMEPVSPHALAPAAMRKFTHSASSECMTI